GPSAEAEVRAEDLLVLRSFLQSTVHDRQCRPDPYRPGQQARQGPDGVQELSQECEEEEQDVLRDGQDACDSRGAVLAGNIGCLMTQRPAGKVPPVFQNQLFNAFCSARARLISRAAKIIPHPAICMPFMVSPNHRAAKMAVHTGSTTMITTPWLCVLRLCA